MSHPRRNRIRWSVYAGLFLFVCGTATAFLLADVLALLASVIGLPAGYALVILASPALLVGSIVWWAVVERRESYSYLLGGAVGLVTALLTGLPWTVRFVRAWGAEMLAIDPVSLIAATVLGVVAVAGTIAGPPLMYARRRFGGAPSRGNERTVSTSE